MCKRGGGGQSGRQLGRGGERGTSPNGEKVGDQRKKRKGALSTGQASVKKRREMVNNCWKGSLKVISVKMNKELGEQSSKNKVLRFVLGRIGSCPTL